MSVFGWLFLMLSVGSGALSAFAGLNEFWNAAAQSCAALFGVLFLVSVVVGRRVKFDPVLR